LAAIHPLVQAAARVTAPLQARVAQVQAQATSQVTRIVVGTSALTALFTTLGIITAGGLLVWAYNQRR
jgi:hypothetical protein